MSTNCEGYFQQIQALERKGDELRKTAADLRRTAPAWVTSPNATPDSAWAAAFEKAMARLNSDEIQGLIAEAMDQQPRTRIADEQMLPFQWLTARRDPQTVEDYAQFSQLVIGGTNVIDPAYRAQLGTVYGPQELAGMIAKAYEDFIGPGNEATVLQRLAVDAAPFQGLVARMTRLRVAFEATRGNYLARVYQMADDLEAGKSTTGEQRRGLLNAWKLAMATEAHFDLARRRTGQTLRSLQEDPGIPAQVLDNQELYLAVSPEDVDGPVVADGAREVLEELLPAPEDAIKPESHVAQVIKAVLDAQIDPKKAAQVIRSLAGAAKVAGLDPAKRLKTEGDFFNYYLKLGNGLAKDGMVANSNSQILNLGSNVNMAIAGPLRLAVENVGTAVSYGTKLNRATILDSMAQAWKGTAEALALTRAHARALWLDSFLDGMTIYGGQVDAYKHSRLSGDLAAMGRARANVGFNQLEVNQWEAMVTAKIPEAFRANPANPWHLYRQLHWTFMKGQAALRLTLHKDFGVPVAALKPGFRLMAATDNVAGYFFRALKVRNELYTQARFDPELRAQIGDTPEAVNRWVDEQFAAEFKGIQPTEREVKRWRQDKGLGPDVPDEVVLEQILAFRDETNRAGRFGLDMEQGRVDLGDSQRVDYGIPAEGDELAVAGREFSEQMRFQREDDSPGGKFIAPTMGLMRNARSHWWVDQQFPFMQAPLLGTMFDWDMATGPVQVIVGAARWNRMDAKARSRMVGRWVTSGVLLSMFVALDAADGDREDLIVGNGPPAGPEREEWLARIRAAGRQPNTVAGGPVAGFPLLNTLMLWRDFKDAMKRAHVSKFDQATILTGIMQLATGALVRTPGVGQVRTIMNLLQNTSSGAGQRIAGFAAYQQGSFGIPFIGAVRQGARAFSGGTRWEGYESGTPQASQRAAELDDDALEKVRASLGNMLSRILGTAPPALGYAAKETDWLGNPIRMPWGMTAVDALKDYAFPQLWPDGEVKLYAELDMLDRLAPPPELMKRQLDGVAMSGELQRLYVQTRSQVVGGDAPLSEMLLLGQLPKLNLPFGFEVQNDALGTVGQTQNLGTAAEIPLGMLAADAIQGRTEAEAYRALFSDPRWRRLMANPTTTANPAITDRPGAAINKTPPMRVIDSIRLYYGTRTRQALRKSEDPAAVDWQRKVLILNDQETRNRNSSEGVMETIRALGGE